MLPLLKQAIKLPEDVDHLERLNNAISNAMSDNDRDVSTTARLINDTFKRTVIGARRSSNTRSCTSLLIAALSAVCFIGLASRYCACQLTYSFGVKL